MAETTRSGVDEYRHLPPAEAVRLRSRIEDLVDALHLDEVVAGTHRPELPAAALLRAPRDRVRIGAVEPAVRLRAVDVLRTLRDDAAAFAQDALQVDALSAFASCARRNGARDLMHERRPPVAELVDVERKREQPHAAVDVVADSTRRDDAVGELHRGQPADREPVTLVDVRHRDRR